MRVLRGFWGPVLLVVAAVSCATAIYLVLTLPTRAIDLGGGLPPNLVAGAFHIHSNRSDGTGTIDEIAAAASRAGLSFVVITDHGDGTRAPDPPAYRHGVLCIDAIEIGSDAGHVVALGLSGATTYPLGGDPRDVLDDVHRLGGTAIAAHPDSPQRGLSWRGPLQGIDGLEWLNVDAEWRDERALTLLRTAFRSIFRAPESIASLFDRPVETLRRWDGLLQSRKVISVAALDAHARIPWRETEEPRGATALARPTYDSMFRTLTQVAVLPTRLTGNAAEDAAQVLASLAEGRSYSVVDAFAHPATLTFRAEQAGRVIEMGGTFDPDAGPVTFVAEVAQAPGALVTLLEGGRRVTSGARLRHTVPTPGRAYRVEVSLPGTDRAPAGPTREGGRLGRPWIVSNAIVASRPSGPPAGTPQDPPEDVPVMPLPPAPTWTVEHDPASRAELVAEGDARRLNYALGAGAPSGQYAALVAPGHREAGADRVQFVARANRPMRISLQLRLPGGRDGLRWRKSVFVDETPRPIVVRLRDLTPVGPTTTSQRPFVAPVHSVLFVVDTVNTAPGAKGTVWVSEVALGLGSGGGQ